VALPGFYDGVPELPEDIAAQWRELDFDERHFWRALALARLAARPGAASSSRLARPTCDMNGIVGGYTGKGSKTVLPAQASAKFSFRLVGRRTPRKLSRNSTLLCANGAGGRDGGVYLAWASGAINLPFGSEALKRRAGLADEWASRRR